jgi:hypothetical protein
MRDVIKTLVSWWPVLSSDRFRNRRRLALNFLAGGENLVFDQLTESSAQDLIQTDVDPVLASSIPAENGFEDFETISTPVSDTSARGILVDVDTSSDTDELCCSDLFFFCEFFL